MYVCGVISSCGLIEEGGGGSVDGMSSLLLLLLRKFEYCVLGIG